MDLFYENIYTHEQVEAYLEAGLAVDGRAGGLILGRSHDEGGIPVLKWNGQVFIRDMEFEGYEYIFSSYASHMYMHVLDELNQHGLMSPGAPFIEYPLLHNPLIIDAKFPNSSKAIVLGYYKTFILNKKASQLYLKSLDAMNRNVFMEEEKIFFLEHAIPLYRSDEFIKDIIL